MAEILPMPNSTTIHVVRDVPGANGLPWWQIVARWPDAHVGTYTLATDDDGHPAIDVATWQVLAAQLVAQHPECLFSYL